MSALPIPTYEDPRTYFVFADVETKAAMTFGVTHGIQRPAHGTARQEAAYGHLAVRVAFVS
ncbi:MAG: hypothetical protein ACXVY8_01450 [Gaiellaceae bacterium]